MQSASRPNPAIISMLADMRSPPDVRLAGCSHLMEMGWLKQARMLLGRLPQDGAVGEEVRRLLAVCSLLETADPGPVVAPEFEAGGDEGDFSVVRMPSDTTVIAFAGKARKVGISVYFMRRLFSRLRCNLVFVFDHRNTFYLQGIESLGPDLAATVARLHETVEGLQTRRLFCIGQSMGGYAAIHYGQALGATGVLAFSPLVQTLLHAKRREDLSRRIGRPLQRAEVDLRTQRVAAETAPRLHIVYGALNGADARSASHLADLAGVQVTPIGNLRHHGSFQACLLAGSFMTFVNDLVGVPAPVG